MKNGYTKAIAKLIKAFLSLNQDRLKSLLEEEIKVIPDKIQYDELPGFDDTLNNIF